MGGGLRCDMISCKAFQKMLHSFLFFFNFKIWSLPSWQCSFYFPLYVRYRAKSRSMACPRNWEIVPLSQVCALHSSWIAYNLCSRMCLMYEFDQLNMIIWVGFPTFILVHIYYHVHDLLSWMGSTIHLILLRNSISLAELIEWQHMILIVVWIWVLLIL